MIRLYELQQELQSDDWLIALDAAEELATIGGQAALDILLPLLVNSSRSTRNAAALALRDMGENAAAEPLVHAIQRLCPEDDRSTLVYALQTLDCSHFFRFLFSLSLDGTYVEQVHALDILYDQEFWFTPEDLVAAQKELEAYVKRIDRPSGTDLLIRDLVELLDDLRQQAQSATTMPTDYED